MIRYEEIKTVAPRKSVYPYKAVFLPHLTKAVPGSEEHLKWQMENWWMVDYHVMSADKPKAVALALRLQDLYVNNEKDPEIPNIVAELRALRSIDFCNFTPEQRWWWGACQLKNYAGNCDEWDAIVKALEVYKGQVLEALSGHHSYFEPSQLREITALDGCKESLERYPYSTRRICCDVDQIADGGFFPFCDPNHFDVVSVCFGYKYPANVASLMREFRRILKPNGTLSFVESKTHGYPELKKREFTPEKIIVEFEEAGFVKVQCLPMLGTGEGRTVLYHATGTK